jgi:hypothetical protein
MLASRIALLPDCLPRIPSNACIAALALLAAIAAPGAAFAQSSSAAPDIAPAEVTAWDAPEPWRTDRFYLATSVYTRHFHYDAAHDNHQDLIQGEWNVTTQWLAGVSLFDNSFGQDTQYAYGGYRFRPLEILQPLFVKVTAGFVHGYRGQYQDKIPFNKSGYAPVVIPSVGYCVIRFCSEVVFFGASGAMVTFGVTIP